MTEYSDALKVLQDQLELLVEFGPADHVQYSQAAVLAIDALIDAKLDIMAGISKDEQA